MKTLYILYDDYEVRNSIKAPDRPSFHFVTARLVQTVKRGRPEIHPRKLVPAYDR